MSICLADVALCFGVMSSSQRCIPDVPYYCASYSKKCKSGIFHPIHTVGSFVQSCFPFSPRQFQIFTAWQDAWKPPKTEEMTPTQHISVSQILVGIKGTKCLGCKV